MSQAIVPFDELIEDGHDGVNVQLYRLGTARIIAAMVAVSVEGVEGAIDPKIQVERVPKIPLVIERK